MSRWRRLLDEASSVGILALGLVLLSLFVAGASPELERVVIKTLINLVVVIGLYIFIGNSGVLSFGHVGFMGVAAYTSALLTIPVISKSIVIPDLPGFLASAELSGMAALAVAVGLVGVVAFVVGLPLMRLAGVAASIATLSFLIIVSTVLRNYEALTGGGGTLTGVPITTTLPVALTWAVLALITAYAFQRSTIGLRLRASREDEFAARSVGVGIVRERIAAFTLSAMVVGLGGVLYGHYLGSFSPDAFYFQITFLTLAMLVVGGMRSLLGAVAGTIAVATISEVLGRFEEGVSILGVDISARVGLREVILAVLVVAVLIWRPAGLTGGREIPPARGLLKWRPSRRAKAAAIQSEDRPGEVVS